MSAVDVLASINGAQRFAGAHFTKMVERFEKSRAKADAKGIEHDKASFEGELAAVRARYVIEQLGEARAAVAELIEAASAGTEEPGDRAVSNGLYFGPQRATRLRAALARVGGGK